MVVVQDVTTVDVAAEPLAAEPRVVEPLGADVVAEVAVD